MCYAVLYRCIMHLKCVYKELAMTDYKAMYLKMMSAAEKAIDILISAQQECEALYIDSDDSEGEGDKL